MIIHLNNPQSASPTDEARDEVIDTKTPESHNKANQENVFRLLRILHNFSKTELAEKLSCSPSYISGIENGTKKISMSMLEKISSVYEMEPHHILYLLNSYEVEDYDPKKATKPYRNVLLQILKTIVELEDKDMEPFLKNLD